MNAETYRNIRMTMRKSHLEAADSAGLDMWLTIAHGIAGAWVHASGSDLSMHDEILADLHPVDPVTGRSIMEAER